MLSPVASAVERGLASVEIHAKRCARAGLIADQTCTACGYACPRAAIGLNPLHLDLSSCDGCGICVGACPSAAVQPSAPVRLRLTKALRDAAGQPFVVRCAKAGADRGALTVPCLEAVPWPVFASAALLGATRVELARGACDDCRLARGAEVEARFRSVSTVLRVATPHVPIKMTVRASIDCDPATERSMSRRGLFGAFARRSQSVAAELLHSLDRASVSPATDEAPWGYALLATLLRARRTRGAVPAAFGMAGRPQVRAEGCTACGVCVRACPTAALHLRDRALLLYPEHCVGCDRCAEVCPERVIEVSRSIELSEWGFTCLLVPSKAARCPVCGGAQSPGVPGVAPCDTCQRERRGVLNSGGGRRAGR